jgi:hypothetical protein
MRKSLSRQTESALAMQRSINLQKQAVQRQTGNGSEGDFFTLPEPASLPRTQQPAPSAETAGEVDPAGPDGSLTGEDRAANVNRDEDGQRLFAPIFGETLPKTVSDIGSLVSLASFKELTPTGGLSESGFRGGESSGDSILERMLMRQVGDSGQLKSGAVEQQGMASDTGVYPLSRGTAALDYIRQILRFSTDGATLFQGFAGEP